MDINPIASFGPQLSITLSPISILIRPDWTIYMQEPGSPLLKTMLPALNVTVAPARVAGPWKRPLAAMADEIATSAKLLADVAPDLIVFHCTDTSMTQGPQGEGRILDIIQDATGITALATSRLVLEALQALGLRSPILLSPSKR